MPHPPSPPPFTRLRNLFRKAGDSASVIRLTAQENSPLAFRSFTDSAMHGAGGDFTTQADEYMRSAWVYVAITRIAEAAALVPVEVFALEGESRIAQIDHPLERLLRAPNPFMSQFELLESTFGTLELTGNAYWFLGGESGGTPSEVWPLRPDRVSIVPDSREYVRGYVYTVGGAEIPLQRDEVIHFKRWHPASDYYGLSALGAASSASQMDRAQQKWNINFFGRDKAVPAGLISIRNMIDDANFERITREFRESFGGADRRTAFIRGADVQWSDVGMSQRDSDFLSSREFNKREIFQVFGIPGGLYDPNATQANATIARQTFLEDTIYPKLVRFGQKLTQGLAPFFGHNLIVAPQEIRDTAADLAEIAAAAPYLTINEVRARYFNRAPVGWGEGKPR